jgi:hypothetical protein
LKQRGIGIVAASQQLAAAQYADDAEVFLLSLADVPTFMSCMTDFAKASGQCLNPTKTCLLHIGQQQAQAAAPGGATLAVGTMQIVAKPKSLGVFFDRCGKSSVDWDGRLTIVRHRMQNISRISKLSAFGRAFAANAYALSTLLYAAQFAGHVPADVAAKLTKWAAALVDAGLGPDDICEGLLVFQWIVCQHVQSMEDLACCQSSTTCCRGGHVKRCLSCKVALHLG